MQYNYELAGGLECIQSNLTLDAAAVVAQKKHLIMNKKIGVRFVPVPSVPKDYEKDKLILKGIPEEVMEEYLVTFVENRLGLDEGEHFSIDFRKTCAVLLFTQPYSDEGMIIIKL